MKVQIKLFDTLSGHKETLSSQKRLNIFVCGPTVYDYLHIGNGRTYLVFDAFVKFLRSQKIKAFYLQNITDIDDKIIVRAKEKNIKPSTLATQFKKVYKSNMKALGVTAVDTYAPATKFIPQIVTQVETLIKKGHVYKIEDDGYYFDVKTFPDYGKLSRRTVEAAEDGVTRIDESVNKRNRADFCVWKFSKPGEPFWKTSLGSGRPGWHIEDTAISEHFFGPQYDIHGGGIDLKFPHHEAEIAQQESASGKKPFVKTWMHVGALTVNGKKMSKSLGNFITIEDFLSKHSGETLRLLSLQNHYRSPLNYTEESALSAEEAWSSILQFIEKLRFTEKSKTKAKQARFVEEIKNTESKFREALEDDFNTPEALAALFGLINKVQNSLYETSKGESKKIRLLFEKSLESMGFSLKSSLKIPSKIKSMTLKREECRRFKQFVQADSLRKEIDKLGYVIEDTPQGPFVWPKRISSNYLHKT